VSAPTRSRALLLGALSLGLAFLGWAAAGPASRDTSQAAVDASLHQTIPPSSARVLAERQRAASFAFAQRYTGRCTRPTGALPRVLLTAFGPYDGGASNASAAALQALVPALPAHAPPLLSPGAVEPPERHLVVAQGEIALGPGGPRRVAVCAMVLPSHWDLPAALVARELDAFVPELVLMTGQSFGAQQVTLERTAINHADHTADATPVGFRLAPTALTEPVLGDPARPWGQLVGMRLDWDRALDAMHRTRQRYVDTFADGAAFGALVDDVLLRYTPHGHNRFLCNALAFTVSALMDAQGQPVTLQRTARAVGDRAPVWRLRVAQDLREVPRVFVHMPSAVAGAHAATMAEMLRALLASQMRPLRRRGRDTMRLHVTSGLDPHPRDVPPRPILSTSRRRRT